MCTIVSDEIGQFLIKRVEAADVIIRQPLLKLLVVERRLIQQAVLGRSTFSRWL